MDLREWKIEALWYIKRAREWSKSPYRQEREYADYIKRFLFGDCKIALDDLDFRDNETWQIRKIRRELPMPTNVYLYM